MSKTIEFETELTGSPTLSTPPEIAAALPSKGKVTIVVVVDMDPEDTTWRKAAYEQFLNDDSEEDERHARHRTVQGHSGPHPTVGDSQRNVKRAEPAHNQPVRRCTLE